MAQLLLVVDYMASDIVAKLDVSLMFFVGLLMNHV